MQHSSEPGPAELVPVVVALERPLDRHAEVVRLVLRELGELDSQVGQVQPRDLLVEMTRQQVHALLVLSGVR